MSHCTSTSAMKASIGGYSGWGAKSSSRCRPLPESPPEEEQGGARLEEKDGPGLDGAESQWRRTVERRTRRQEALSWKGWSEAGATRSGSGWYGQGRTHG